MGTIISISLTIIFSNNLLDIDGIISYMIRIGHTRLCKSVCNVGQCHKINSNMFEIGWFYVVITLCQLTLDASFWTRNTVTHYIFQMTYISMVSCQKGPNRHAYACQIGPLWQDTLNMMLDVIGYWIPTEISSLVGFHSIVCTWSCKLNISTYVNRPISRYYRHLVAVMGRCSISYMH